MSSSERLVKTAHPRAAKKRYTKNDGGSYYLIWSDQPDGRDSVRLGSGKTAVEAWVKAAEHIRRTANADEQPGKQE